MAKKKNQPVRQQRIPGTVDTANQAVMNTAEEYVTMLQTRMGCQESENVLRAELIDLMLAHGLLEFTLDSHEVKLVHTEKDKVTVKKLAETDD